jgi:hypothetical protein
VNDRRIRALVFSCAASLLLAAGPPSPLAPGPAPDLDIAFTSQVAGWTEPCG